MSKVTQFEDFTRFLDIAKTSSELSISLAQTLSTFRPLTLDCLYSHLKRYSRTNKTFTSLSKEVSDMTTFDLKTFDLGLLHEV